MPVPKECTNVIIVADNDGDNVTVKQTMIEIAQYSQIEKKPTTYHCFAPDGGKREVGR